MKAAHRRVETHAYQPSDTPPDHRGEVPCATCKAPKRNSRHHLPETPEAARERDAAVLGEKGDSA